MKPILLFLLLSGCAKPNFSAVSRPQADAPSAMALHPRQPTGSDTNRQGLRGADLLSITPTTNVFQVRTVTWITVDPALERVTRIQRVPVLYSNGVRIGPRR